MTGPIHRSLRWFDAYKHRLAGAWAIVFSAPLGVFIWGALAWQNTIQNGRPYTVHTGVDVALAFSALFWLIATCVFLYQREEYIACVGNRRSRRQYRQQRQKMLREQRVRQLEQECAAYDILDIIREKC